MIFFATVLEDAMKNMFIFVSLGFISAIVLCLLAVALTFE